MSRTKYNSTVLQSTARSPAAQIQYNTDPERLAMVYHPGEASHAASFPTGRLPEDHLLPAGGKLTENTVYFGKHLKNNKAPK